MESETRQISEVDIYFIRSSGFIASTLEKMAANKDRLPLY